MPIRSSMHCSTNRAPMRSTRLTRTGSTVLDCMSCCRAVSRFFWMLLVVLAAQVVALPNVLAYEQGRTEYGARLRLTSLPARVRLDAPVPDLFDGGRPPLLRAIAEWNARACSSPLFVMTEEDD